MSGNISMIKDFVHLPIQPEYDLVFQSTACDARIKVCLSWYHHWVLSCYKQNSDQREDITKP